MNLYNHLTNEINSINKNRINMYVCGSTVHAISHIGHARTYSIFDSIRKFLISQKCIVNYGMNVTDIDQKIITKVTILHYYNLVKKICQSDQSVQSVQSVQPVQPTELYKITQSDEIKEILNNIELIGLNKISPNDLKHMSAKLEFFLENCIEIGIITEDIMTPPYETYKQFIDEKTNLFWKEMDQINIARPTTIIRVSDVIVEIQQMIDDLISKNYAYESNGSVYFDTTNYNQNFCQCALNNSTENDISIKNTYNEEKKNPHDFALWKKAKPRSICWDSKWGKGTAGWHIECSLISSKMFKDNIDLHGGGIDLKYPHHHNEVLQSNSYYAKFDVFKHFAYVGHVCTNGEKMAQSVGNYTSLEDYLLAHSSNSLRLLFWLSPWYNPVELSDSLVNQAVMMEKRIEEFLSTINYNLNLPSNSQQDIMLNSQQDITLIFDKFEKINDLLRNNFETTQAIIEFNNIITTLNILIKTNSIDNAILSEISKLSENLLNIIGWKIKKSSNNNVIDDLRDLKIIEKLLEFRNLLRKNGQYNLSDEIRENIIPLFGYKIQDLKDGTKIQKI